MSSSGVPDDPGSPNRLQGGLRPDPERAHDGLPDLPGRGGQCASGGPDGGQRASEGPDGRPDEETRALRAPGPDPKLGASVAGALGASMADDPKVSDPEGGQKSIRHDLDLFGEDLDGPAFHAALKGLGALFRNVGGKVGGKVRGKSGGKGKSGGESGGRFSGKSGGKGSGGESIGKSSGKSGGKSGESIGKSSGKSGRSRKSNGSLDRSAPPRGDPQGESSGERLRAWERLPGPGLAQEPEQRAQILQRLQRGSQRGAEGSGGSTQGAPKGTSGRPQMSSPSSLTPSLTPSVSTRPRGVEDSGGPRRPEDEGPSESSGGPREPLSTEAARAATGEGALGPASGSRALKKGEPRSRVGPSGSTAEPAKSDRGPDQGPELDSRLGAEPEARPPGLGGPIRSPTEVWTREGPPNDGDRLRRLERAQARLAELSEMADKLLASERALHRSELAEAPTRPA